MYEIQNYLFKEKESCAQVSLHIEKSLNSDSCEKGVFNLIRNIFSTLKSMMIKLSHHSLGESSAKKTAKMLVDF